MAANMEAQIGLSDYRQMLDSITDYAMIRIDPNGLICSWHPGAERLTQYTAQEAVGRSIALFHTQEDARARLAEQEIATAARDGRFETEGWRVRKDGSRFWASVVLSSIRDDQGQVRGSVKVTRDLTERREQVLAMRGVEQMLDAITEYEVIRLDRNGIVQSWSPGATRMKQYTKDEVLGKHVSMFYTPEDVKSGLAEREMSAAARDGRFDTEGWRVRKDGSRFWASVVLSPIRGEQEEVEGYVKVSRDLTLQRERDQVLQRQRDEILELSTPVIQVWDKILVLPIIGILDSLRASRLTENLLVRIASDLAEVVILDVSGLPAIDTDVAQHLLKTVEAARLMGTASVLSGVRPETAQTMVNLGIELGGLLSLATLRDALQLALRLVNDKSPAGSQTDRA
ncbi:MAG TPA: PAS domain S-box protein [Streptosporangiaceae bacterium]|jgi:PAS domain S-box-containing protein|nr:PAS domain S-box protein [Streptosporangiaceae bacterium]